MMRYCGTDSTVTGGYLREEQRKLRFSNDNYDIIVGTIYDDKSVDNDGNNLHLSYTSSSRK